MYESPQSVYMSSVQGHPQCLAGLEVDRQNPQDNRVVCDISKCATALQTSSGHIPFAQVLKFLTSTVTIYVFSIGQMRSVENKLLLELFGAHRGPRREQHCLAGMQGL